MHKGRNLRCRTAQTAGRSANSGKLHMWQKARDRSLAPVSHLDTTCLHQVPKVHVSSYHVFVELWSASLQWSYQQRRQIADE